MAALAGVLASQPGKQAKTAESSSPSNDPSDLVSAFEVDIDAVLVQIGSADNMRFCQGIGIAADYVAQARGSYDLKERFDGNLHSAECALWLQGPTVGKRSKMSLVCQTVHKNVERSLANRKAPGVPNPKMANAQMTKDELLEKVDEQSAEIKRLRSRLQWGKTKDAPMEDEGRAPPKAFTNPPIQDVNDMLAIHRKVMTTNTTRKREPHLAARSCETSYKQRCVCVCVCVCVYLIVQGEVHTTQLSRTLTCGVEFDTMYSDMWGRI